MHLADSDLDSFCSCLCEHEHEVVGRSGMTYHCPLALWLSERSGHTYGVDGRVYGRASCAYHCWRLLPRWAEVFVAWSPGTGLSSSHRLRGTRPLGEC